MTGSRPDPRDARFTLRLMAISGIAVAYLAVRSLIYFRLPGHCAADWVFRDAVMDIPRVVGFALAFFLGARFWGARASGFHPAGGMDALRWGIPWIAMTFTIELFRPDGYYFPAPALALIALNSFFVALFEETLFRGAFVNALADLFGPWRAITVSALLFTVFHVQVVRFAEWPLLFAHGIFYGVLRRHGVGLPWLISLHWTFDSIFFLGHDGSLSIPVRVATYSALALFLVACNRSLRKNA